MTTPTPSAPDSQKLRAVQLLRTNIANVLIAHEHDSEADIKWCPQLEAALEKALTPLLLTASAGQEAGELLLKAAKVLEEMDRIHCSIMDNGLNCVCGDDPDNCVRCSKSSRLSDKAHAMIAKLEAAAPSPLPVVETPSANTQEGEDRDAARYRWLRKMIFDDRIIIQPDRMLYGTELDSAVDAAMEASK